MLFPAGQAVAMMPMCSYITVGVWYDILCMTPYWRRPSTYEITPKMIVSNTFLDPNKELKM